MLGLSAYQLKQRWTPAAVFYEFFDPETGRLVGVARFETYEPEKTNRLLAFQLALFDSPSYRWLGVLVGLVMIPFVMVAAFLGLLSTHPQRQ